MCAVCVCCIFVVRLRRGCAFALCCLELGLDVRRLLLRWARKKRTSAEERPSAAMRETREQQRRRARASASGVLGASVRRALLTVFACLLLDVLTFNCDCCPSSSSSNAPAATASSEAALRFFTPGAHCGVELLAAAPASSLLLACAAAAPAVLVTLLWLDEGGEDAFVDCCAWKSMTASNMRKQQSAEIDSRCSASGDSS
jgi:hypothetical protein